MNDKSSRKPYLILISGAPGSGKSMLARKLTQYIEFMYVDADAVLQSLWLHNTTNGVPLLYDLLTKNASNYNLSQVVDMATSADSETIEKLKSVATLRHLHCKAGNANKRFYAREIRPDGTEPDWLDPKMRELEEKIVPNSKPPDFGVKVIEVKTDNEYTPNIKSLVETMNIPQGYKRWSKFG